MIILGHIQHGFVWVLSVVLCGLASRALSHGVLAVWLSQPKARGEAMGTALRKVVLCGWFGLGLLGQCYVQLTLWLLV